MSNTPVRRHFMSERVGWTARRISRPTGIRFVSAFGEERLLPLERSKLPTDEQLAAASEGQLHDWLAHSRRNLRAELTAVERALLDRIAEAGGRCTFQADRPSILAYRVFDEGTVAVLLALQAKRFVRIEGEGTESVRQRGEPPRIRAITAVITDAGRETLSLG